MLVIDLWHDRKYFLKKTYEIKINWKNRIIGEGRWKGGVTVVQRYKKERKFDQIEREDKRIKCFFLISNDRIYIVWIA